MKYRHILGFSLAAALAVGFAVGQEKSAAPKADESDEAVRAVSASFVKAYNARDAKALGALFTEGAEIEDDDGTVTQGRDAIVERYSERFADSGQGKLDVDIDSIRFLSPTLAVESGTATIKTEGGPDESNRYTVLYAKQDGHWLHARIKDEESTPETPNERLKDLEWMLGEWVNESDDAIVSTKCEWSDDGTFLLRKFDIKVEGVVALKGTQRIGWDAAIKQFRTWIFDNGGGFAEGVLAQDGERWIVKVSGVRADGQTVSATNTITRMGPDRLGWESADRTLGGEIVPGVDQFFMVRKPPEPTR